MISQKQVCFQFYGRNSDYELREREKECIHVRVREKEREFGMEIRSEEINVPLILIATTWKAAGMGYCVYVTWCIRNKEHLVKKYFNCCYRAACEGNCMSHYSCIVFYHLQSFKQVIKIMR
jgi:hypothetical protein